MSEYRYNCTKFNREDMSPPSETFDIPGYWTTDLNGAQEYCCKYSGFYVFLITDCWGGCGMCNGADTSHFGTQQFQDYFRQKNIPLVVWDTLYGKEKYSEGYNLEQSLFKDSNFSMPVFCILKNEGTGDVSKQRLVYSVTWQTGTVYKRKSTLISDKVVAHTDFCQRINNSSSINDSYIGNYQLAFQWFYDTPITEESPKYITETEDSGYNITQRKPSNQIRIIEPSEDEVYLINGTDLQISLSQKNTSYGTQSNNCPEGCQYFWVKVQNVKTSNVYTIDFPKLEDQEGVLKACIFETQDKLSEVSYDYAKIIEKCDIILDSNQCKNGYRYSPSEKVKDGNIWICFTRESQPLSGEVDLKVCFTFRIHNSSGSHIIYPIGTSNNIISSLIETNIKKNNENFVFCCGCSGCQMCGQHSQMLTSFIGTSERKETEEYNFSYVMLYNAYCYGTYQNGHHKFWIEPTNNIDCSDKLKSETKYSSYDDIAAFYKFIDIDTLIPEAVSYPFFIAVKNGKVERIYSSKWGTLTKIEDEFKYFQNYFNTQKKKRIISRTMDVFVAGNIIHDINKNIFNVGDQSRNLTAEIGIWNGNLPLVLKQADLCCIPVLIMKGIGNCYGHQTKLQSKGFLNWQLSCNIFLSYEMCAWGTGYSEGYIENNSYQYHWNKNKEEYITSCPMVMVHWKNENGKVFNLGKLYKQSKDNLTTGLAKLEPYAVEQLLSDYYLQYEDIDLSSCVVDKDTAYSITRMNMALNNSMPYKEDYNFATFYLNIDNLKIYQSKYGIPIVAFYENTDVVRKHFWNTIGFSSSQTTQIDKWKNNNAKLLWGYVQSKDALYGHEKANLSGEWHVWIGDLSNNTDWYSQPFLIKVYDPDRGVDNSFSFDQISSYIKKDSELGDNFISFFTTQLSDYYNGVQKKEYYSVTFQDYDGSQIGDVQKLEYGQDAIPPTASRTGYVFTKWVPDYHGVSSDLTCVANYNKEQQQEEEQEESENEGTIRVVKIQDFGKLGTSFTYSDSKSHKLRISNNVIGEILASQNENGLKSQLTEVVYTSQNIKELSSYCFHGCHRLQTIDLLSTNITKLGDGCFEGCSSLTSINLPKNLEILNSRMFSGCANLKDISLKFSSLGDISQNSLVDSNLETIYLENMTSSDMYQYCSSMLIRFDKNNPNATGEMSSIQLEFGQTWVCPKCEYTYDGYRFTGKWSTNSDGSGIEYIPQTTYQFVNGTFTLYAQWKEKGKVFAILETCMKNGYGSLLAGCKYGPQKMYNMIEKCYDSVEDDVTVHIMSDSEGSKVGSYSIESPTKDNILNNLREGLNGDYDLVIMFISDHGSASGSIGVKGGTLSGKEVANVIKQGHSSTRIMLICDMCHAESFSPFKAVHGSTENGDFFDQMFKEFDNQKLRMKSSEDQESSENIDPKLLGWYTCDSSHYGWMSESRGMYFLNRIVSKFSKDKTYQSMFQNISEIPYWYSDSYYGYNATKPKGASISAYNKKRNYNNNFDETQLVFR